MKKVFLTFFICIITVVSFIAYTKFGNGDVINTNTVSTKGISEENGSRQEDGIISTPSSLVALKSETVSPDKSSNLMNTPMQGSHAEEIFLHTDKIGDSDIQDDGNNAQVVEIQGLIELIKLDDSFVLDIKYATEDNFTSKIIYTKAKCFIHKNTAQKLISANNEFKQMGYRIKIFDAYRPFDAQQVLWDAAQDKSFVADPKKGSIHNRGAAVDVTFVDMEGNEADMPSGYDDFSERAKINYNGCSQIQRENRELLGEIMIKHGFKRISNEWWHFEDTDAKNYPILNLSFEEFLD